MDTLIALKTVTCVTSSSAIFADSVGGSDGVRALELLLATRLVSMRTAFPPEGSSRSSVAEKDRAGSRDSVLRCGQNMITVMMNMKCACLHVS